METTFSVEGSEAERFWARINILGVDECWVPKNAVGKPPRYHVYRDASGRSAGTHRYAYAYAKGSFSKSLTIDHLCRNPACSNPNHLEAVTYLENNLRSSRVTKTHCKRNHPYSGDNIYYSPKGDRSCVQCRRESERRYAEKLKEKRKDRGLYKRYSPGERVIGHSRKITK